MSKMKKPAVLLSMVMLLSVALLLAGCGGSGNGSSGGKGNDVIKIRLGYTLAPGNHYDVMSRKFGELVAQKTSNKVKVEVFPQSQLGGEVQMIQAAKVGTQEMLITAQAPLENTVKEWTIFDMPYLFDSIDQANAVLNGPVGDRFLKMLPQHGLIGLGWLSVMERNVFSSKPINSLPNMKGMKIRVMEAPGYVQAYTALGATPTPMAYNEVYTALQQGVVDGGDTSPDQFNEDKFIEVAKYYNITHVHYLPAVLLVSKKTYDTWSPDIQKAVQDSASEALKYGRDYYKEAYKKSLDKAREKGVQVIQTDVAPFKEAVKPVYDKLLKDIPQGEELYKAIQEAKQKAS